MVTALSMDNFDASVKGKLVLVDFWAEWCGPCKKMAPVFEKLSHTYHGKPNFFKVDVDQNQGLAERFGVSSIPTTILLKDGTEIGRLVGFYPEDALKEKIDQLLAKVQ